MVNNDNKWGIVYCPKKSKKFARKRWARIEHCLHERGVNYE